jgi:hypothetical protein
MAFSDMNQLLDALLATTCEADVRAILGKIGDHPDLAIDQEFGPFKLCWHPFGNNASNISSVNLGTKPGRSLTERLTNAEDALLEDRVSPGVATPRSAREAVKQWFGRPVTGPDDGMFKWSFSDLGYDRRIAVVLNSSGTESAPTIDVFDDGIGLKPDQFPNTILSLQSGNKIQKWYLIGAFGQGGASTLAFCELALIVSRHRDEPSNVGFTLIKVLRLSELYKEDTYAYLAARKPDGTFSVPNAVVTDEFLQLHKPVEGVRLPRLKKGTVVRHYSYKLPYLDGSLSPSPRNLYHYLHCSMFDPILPFRVIDVRDPARAKDELVTGSRNRLMKLAQAGLAKEGEEERGSVLKHHRPMEFIVPPGTQDPCIGIEYWVVFNYKPGSGAKKDELVLRPHSNEIYVQTGHPIVGTLNGQNQGEMTSQLLRDVGLGMVARHIVIHIDATNADRRVRRELFATTREGFKDGTVLTEITQVLRRMLEEDENLAALEKELTEKLAQREAESTSEEVKKQVTRLLLEAGLHQTKEGPSVTPGEGEKQPVKKPGTRKPPIKPDPLPTLPFPQVTKFQIATPKPKMSIQLNDIEFVLAETDADAEFDRRGLVAIRTEPDLLELASKSPLRGGRVRWRLRPRESAKAGDLGKIIATLTKPDGAQLTDTVEFEVLPAAEDKVKKIKGLIPPFEIIPIHPVDDAEKWSMVWPDLADATADDERASVAYKPIPIGGGINVYYSKVFGPFKQLLDKLILENPGMADIFRSNYEVWIGYHAILQQNALTTSKEELEQEVMDRVLESDRTRVAQMQVRQALRTAELMQKVMQSQANE